MTKKQPNKKELKLRVYPHDGRVATDDSRDSQIEECQGMYGGYGDRPGVSAHLSIT